MKIHEVNLPDEFAPVLAELLSPGGWASLDELVMSGLLRSLEELRQPDPNGLKDAVRLGAEQADRGEVVDGPSTIERHRRKLLAAEKQPA